MRIRGSNYGNLLPTLDLQSEEMDMYLGVNAVQQGVKRPELSFASDDISDSVF